MVAEAEKVQKAIELRNRLGAGRKPWSCPKITSTEVKAITKGGLVWSKDPTKGRGSGHES